MEFPGNRQLLRGVCSPVVSAAPALVQAVKVGGITGVVADLTLGAWAASDLKLLLQASAYPVARLQVITRPRP